MLVKRNITELFDLFKRREEKVNDTAELQINEQSYLTYILHYEGIEITPDIELFGYEESITENQYIAENYPDLNLSFWMIGRSGQGDGWFLDKKSGFVLFFDHDQGEYQGVTDLLNFQINFSEFIQTAFLLRELESLLDEGKSPEHLESPLKQGLNSISPLIYSLYPFEYF